MPSRPGEGWGEARDRMSSCCWRLCLALVVSSSSHPHHRHATSNSIDLTVGWSLLPPRARFSRQASDIIKKGKMCSLFINDLDAGAGRMGESTQYTVNNQMVNATLMNIADSPTNVQLPGVYKNEEIPRVPVVCTGNDFSTLYAPLIRDGRMEKYYWNPTREDRVGVCMGIFQVRFALRLPASSCT